MKVGQNIVKMFGGVPRGDVAKLLREQKNIMHRSFEAVSLSRLTKDFLEMNGTIDADIRAGGKRLRDRSRQLYENSPHARRWVDLYVSNVVGELGTTFQSDVKILSEDKETKTVTLVSDEDTNAILEEAFADWSKPENCSVTHSQSFATMMKIAARGKARDGEVFIRRVIDPASKYGLRLQIIPPEMIVENYTGTLDNGNTVVMGVELNEWRMPVAYYVWKTTPQESLWGITGGEMDRIPASEMIHWYDPDFSNQTRGYTRMANVMLMLYWLKDYNRASVLNAKFTARKLGFFSDLNPDDPSAIGSDTKDTKTTTSVNGAETTQSRPAVSGEELSFTYIGNTKLEKWDPNYPHEQHEMFNRVTVREIATGLNCAYCSLSGDYSNSTWSSSRTELNVERNSWLHEQSIMIDTVDIRVYGWFLEFALMKRAIPGGFTYKDLSRLNKPYFIGPRWDYINPVDESNATRSDLEAQLISPFDAAAKRGKKYEDILREINAAAKLRKKYTVADPVYGKASSPTAVQDAGAPDAATTTKPKTNGVAA